MVVYAHGFLLEQLELRVCLLDFVKLCEVVELHELPQLDSGGAED
jgi:hypothetical protein